MKFKGIKKIVSESKTLNGYYDTGCLEVFFDMKEKTAWAKYHVDKNGYTFYIDPNCIRAGYIYDKTTMQEVEKMIEKAYALRSANR